MSNVLIVATTSYAGMGPYVSEIVNGFHADDDVYFFFVDYADGFYKKNIKADLQAKSLFYHYANSAWHKLHDLMTARPAYDKVVVNCCRKWSIDTVHYINEVCSAHMARRLEGMNIKVWNTVHDLHPHESRKAWHKMFRYKVIHRRQMKALASCHNMITNSWSQYEELRRMFPGKTVRYHAFPSLVTSVVAAGGKATPETANLKRPYVLFFGRIEEYKGIALLYEAFLAQPDDGHTLVIAGGGQLPPQVQPVPGRVVIVNRYIADEEILGLYEGAECVVYPYLSATQSGVLSLAFYFGTPVICSDVPFFKSIVVASQSGLLFETGNAEDLKTKLAAFLSHANREEMCARGRRYYEENYDSSAIRTALLGIYQESAK